MTHVTLDEESGGLKLQSDRTSIILHPLWVRERVSGPAIFDPISHQRLYEHAELPQDLRIYKIGDQNEESLKLEFSDGPILKLTLSEVLKEISWQENSESLPKPKSWTANLKDLPEFNWPDLYEANIFGKALDAYFTYGFCIFQNTPVETDSLKRLSRRFGYLRETNFGELFNVETKPNPSDLAYTDVALASHTDNPYRKPVPGIQFLHCLRNEVSGGLSTLVDGMAIAQALRKENAQQADILEKVDVRFRYEGPSAILEHHGPIIERDHDGIIRHIRLSSRLDYVPALDIETLTHFYAGRSRLHKMSNSEDFQISFPFRSGTLLMMDNYRLLHGRTAFNGAQGHRHLQGCYIDHDGPASLFRMLANGRNVTSVIRED
ncbi:TauD/TfdA family dioxygenase [Hellea balneolensis]|uniref:TauD/TfdA family dioxygenase n=1 Tax=Hellea balneolensis TaxID=287478 RepID=UPI0003FAD22A|nr:TauD/TfdA family dioxygenase [Hellea balneolensis]